MWTADSTQITADQTCWTADGYNGCADEYTPGFFTQNQSTAKKKKYRLAAKKNVVKRRNLGLSRTRERLRLSKRKQALLEDRLKTNTNKEKRLKLELSIHNLKEEILENDRKIRIMSEDEDILLFLNIVLSKGLL